MIIDVSKMKSDVVILEKIIDDYNATALNLYNNFFSTSFFWKDNRTEKFIKELETSKIETQTLIKELVSLKDIYQFLVEKYEVMGKKIEFYLENKSSFFRRIDDCIFKIDKIINLYNDIDLSFDSFEFERLQIEKEKIINSKKHLALIKSNFEKCFKYIEEVERKIRQKIVEIDIEILKEREFNEIIEG